MKAEDVSKLVELAYKLASYTPEPRPKDRSRMVDFVDSLITTAREEGAKEALGDLTTIIDERFGLQPVMSADELLAFLESKLCEERQAYELGREEGAKAERQRIRKLAERYVRRWTSEYSDVLLSILHDPAPSPPEPVAEPCPECGFALSTHRRLDASDVYCPRIGGPVAFPEPVAEPALTPEPPAEGERTQDCAHQSVVPYGDGKDGRCEACGETGFPFVDEGYEKFVAAHEREGLELRIDDVEKRIQSVESWLWRGRGKKADSRMREIAREEMIRVFGDGVRKVHAVSTAQDLVGILHESACDDVYPREPGCACHQEVGDSPCPVHKSDDDAAPAPSPDPNMRRIWDAEGAESVVRGDSEEWECAPFGQGNDEPDVVLRMPNQACLWTEDWNEKRFLGTPDRFSELARAYRERKAGGR